MPRLVEITKAIQFPWHSVSKYTQTPFCMGDKSEKEIFLLLRWKAKTTPRDHTAKFFGWKWFWFPWSLQILRYILVAASTSSPPPHTTYPTHMPDAHTHTHLKAQNRGENKRWRQGSGQDVSGYKQKEPATDGPWPQKETEITSPAPAPVKQSHTLQGCWVNSPASSLACLPCFPPRVADRQVTLLGLPQPHWLSLRGGGVGGTTEILLPRGNTRIMD